MVVLKEYLAMTRQEYFDLCKKSAVDGTFPSILNNVEGCVYRGPEGKRCIVGLLIPEDKYDPGIEESTLRTILDAGRIEMPEGLVLRDLESLQILHDRYAVDDTGWKSEAFINDLKRQACFADCT